MLLMTSGDAIMVGRSIVVMAVAGNGFKNTETAHPTRAPLYPYNPSPSACLSSPPNDAAQVDVVAPAKAIVARYGSATASPPRMMAPLLDELRNMT